MIQNHNNFDGNEGSYFFKIYFIHIDLILIKIINCSHSLHHVKKINYIIDRL